MGQITVRAETNTLGMTLGETRTVEDTPFLRNVISGGRLSLVESACADSAASTPPAPDTPAGETPATPGKRGRRPARLDDRAQLDDVAQLDDRPELDDDAALADALVSVRPPDLPPAA